jgi:hypothetical protein
MSGLRPMDMSRSLRRLAVCLLMTAGLAACGSPAPNDNMPIVTSVPSEAPASSGVFSEVPGDSPVPATSAPTAVGQPLPLTLSRTGGIAGVQDQVKIDTNGTATVTHRAGKPTTTTLSAEDLAALRRLLTDPALVREAKAADGAGQQCADGFQYALRTPDLSVKTNDCGRSTHPTLAKVISLALPPGGK